MKIINRFFVLLFFYVFVREALAEQNYSVGFRMIEAQTENGFSSGVWYPSIDEEFEKVRAISSKMGMGR